MQISVLGVLLLPFVFAELKHHQRHHHPGAGRVLDDRFTLIEPIHGWGASASQFNSHHHHDEHELLTTSRLHHRLGLSHRHKRAQHLKPPQDKFTDVRKVGGGEFGIVWRALDANKQEVAVKEFNKKGNTLEQNQALAQAELNAILALDNWAPPADLNTEEEKKAFKDKRKYFIRLAANEILSDAKSAFVVMEFVLPMRLALKLYPYVEGDAQYLTLQPIRQCVRDILGAIEFLELNFAVHQDIKLDNIGRRGVGGPDVAAMEEDRPPARECVLLDVAGIRKFDGPDTLLNFKQPTSDRMYQYVNRQSWSQYIFALIAQNKGQGFRYSNFRGQDMYALGLAWWEMLGSQELPKPAENPLTPQEKTIGEMLCQDLPKRYQEREWLEYRAFTVADEKLNQLSPVLLKWVRVFARSATDYEAMTINLMMGCTSQVRPFANQMIPVLDNLLQLGVSVALEKKGDIQAAEDQDVIAAKALVDVLDQLDDLRTAAFDLASSMQAIYDALAKILAASKGGAQQPSPQAIQQAINNDNGAYGVVHPDDIDKNNAPQENDNAQQPQQLLPEGNNGYDLLNPNDLDKTVLVGNLKDLNKDGLDTGDNGGYSLLMVDANGQIVLNNELSLVNGKVAEDAVIYKKLTAADMAKGVADAQAKLEGQKLPSVYDLLEPADLQEEDKPPQ